MARREGEDENGARDDREGRGRPHPRRVGNLRRPLPRRRRHRRRSLDRMPGQDRGSQAFSPTWSGKPSECGPGCSRPPKPGPPSTWRRRSASTSTPTSNALAAAGSVPMHRHNVRAYLNRLADDCGFDRLADLNREALGAMARRGNQEAVGRLALATLTAPHSSPSPTGAPTRASAGFRRIRSRGCRRPTRRPTLAAGAGR